MPLRKLTNTQYSQFFWVLINQLQRCTSSQTNRHIAAGAIAFWSLITAVNICRSPMVLDIAVLWKQLMNHENTNTYLNTCVLCIYDFTRFAKHPKMNKSQNASHKSILRIITCKRTLRREMAVVLSWGRHPAFARFRPSGWRIRSAAAVRYGKYRGAHVRVEKRTLGVIQTSVICSYRSRYSNEASA